MIWDTKPGKEGSVFQPVRVGDSHYLTGSPDDVMKPCVRDHNCDNPVGRQNVAELFHCFDRIR